MMEKEMSEKPRKEKIQDELKKIKGLSWKQRIVYFWDYYKAVLVILIVIIAGVQITRTIIRNINTEELLNVVFLNSSYTSESAEQLEQDFTDYLGGIEKDQKISLDFSMAVDPQVWDNNWVAVQTKIMAYSVDGELDGIVMPESVYSIFLEQDMFMPLEEVLTANEQEKWSERLLLGKQPETGQEKLYAIRVDDAPMIQKYGLYGEEPVYLAVIATAERTEMILEFLRFLTEE